MGRFTQGNPSSLGRSDESLMDNNDLICRYPDLFFCMDRFPSLGESPDVTYIPPEEASRWTLCEQPDFFRVSAAKALEALGDPGGSFLDSDFVMEMFPIEMCHTNVSLYSGRVVRYREMPFDIDTEEPRGRFLDSFGFSDNSMAKYTWTTRMMRDPSQLGGPLYSVPSEIVIEQQIGIGDVVTKYLLNMKFCDRRNLSRLTSVPIDQATSTQISTIRNRDDVACRGWVIGTNKTSNRPFYVDWRTIQCQRENMSISARTGYKVMFEPFYNKHIVKVLDNRLKLDGHDSSGYYRYLIESLPPDAEAIEQFVKLMDSRFQSEDY